MKKFFVLIAFIGFGLLSYAQPDSLVNKLAIFYTLPAFKIYTAPDSVAFSNKNLHQHKPLVLVFFSPDCDHCQKETMELLAYKNELKSVQILMASPASYGEVKRFYEEYHLASMPNVKMGQDVNFVLGSKFKLTTFPSIFIYDANGKLTKKFVGNIGVPDILAALK